MLMKKIFSFAILLAGTLHALNAGDMKPVSTKIATPAEQKITATNSEVITSTPEGTLIDLLLCIGINVQQRLRRRYGTHR